MRGKAFFIVGHKHWGKSRTLAFLTDSKRKQYFEIKGFKFFVRRMSNDDVAPSFFWLLHHLKPEERAHLLITICPTFTNKREGAKLTTALRSFRKRYALFFFVLRHNFKRPKKLISDEEIEMLEKFGKVRLFATHAEADKRALALMKFVRANL